MESRSKEEQQGGGGVGWMTVPAFGEWDMKNGAVPDYSMDFSKIREMRKQNKRELSRASLGGDEDLLAQQQKAAAAAAQPAAAKADLATNAAVDDHRRPLHAGHDDSPTGRKKFLSYFQCCIRA
uniref:RIN4 pathogenic type III effector avirulence factor Avr cleavage site domain-containing protein n=1 Tax=Leersia perrieri TaxID=77586 RepID=A0A0D9XJI3_9ORYZ